jgi:hypothetical protein
MQIESQSLCDSPLFKQWISQFELKDKEIARQLGAHLRLVSHREFEDGLRNCLTKILQATNGKRVAALTVTEPGPFVPPDNPTKDVRIKASSSERISQLLINLERATDGALYANPTVESMRSERIKHVVLVDDHVGSGSRVVDYWKTRFHPSIKSWISRHWTTLWLVSFSGSEMGLRTVRATIKALAHTRTITATPPRWSGELTNPQIYICQKYGARTRKPSASHGYKGSTTNIVFEHSCPNNAPAILWEYGKKWQPLFPNRGVPNELTRYFGARSLEASADALWNSGQFRLALKLIDDIESSSLDLQTWNILSLAALLSRHPLMQRDDLVSILRITQTEFDALWAQCISLRLIRPGSREITAFARDVLSIKRSRAQRIKTPRIASSHAPYYPASAGGAYRI